jgi:tripartite-type tricarboxylate transporter receptor subunit TctC
MRRLTCAFILAALFTTLSAAAPVAAQSWPTRPVKFILTLGPGSGADIGARLLADRLTKKWDQPIVIENRPGGDGIVAINAFVSAQDDHILLFAPSSSFIGHPYQHDNLPYKPDDLAPIARVSNTVVGISVPMDLPVKTLKDVVELASTKPGQLNWAGLTGALDIMFEGWLKSIGVDIKKVPYRNPVEAANDLAAGRVQVYESAYAIARPQVQSGKIKVLAVTNNARASAIPDPDGRGGRISGADNGWAGRIVWPANYAERTTRAHRRGHQDRDGRRSPHQRPPYHDCPGSQSRRARGVRQIDRRAARGPCQGGEGPWHRAEIAQGSLLKSHWFSTQV